MPDQVFQSGRGGRPWVPADAHGSIARALLWLLGGLVALVLLAVAIAPELLRAPGEFTGVLTVVLLAGIPGFLLLIAALARRRRIDRQDEQGEDR